MQGEASPNHAFALQTALAQSAGTSARLLDFGCGVGHFVGAAREAGVEAWGADTFSGYYAAWHEQVIDRSRPYVRQIVDGKLPWPDAEFDVVISNQVFEHMRWDDVEASLAEIKRVLRPSGVLLAMFPSDTVWFEGHLGLYFPHWLRAWPGLQHAYLKACHKAGFGYYRSGTSQEWAGRGVDLLRDNVFHHSQRGFEDALHRILGRKPQRIEPAYMRFRLGRRAAAIPDFVLSAICMKRAGTILLASRSGPDESA